MTGMEHAIARGGYAPKGRIVLCNRAEGDGASDS